MLHWIETEPCFSTTTIIVNNNIRNHTTSNEYFFNGLFSSFSFSHEYRLILNGYLFPFKWTFLKFVNIIELLLLYLK